MRRHFSYAAVFLLMSVLIAVQGVQAAPAAAAGLPPSASSGYDISWPQCSASYPRGGSFGVVGVTNGRPWGANPCLASEYAWASKYAAAPQVYMNTANPAPHSSFYWPASGSRDPALCRDASSTTDPGCAYDYGWHAAANALSTAASVSAAPTHDLWWLDVETGNTWNGNGSANAADLQGSIDYLRSHGVATVGVYSTGYQWNAITGGYNDGDAATYAAAWRPELTSPNGIASSPSWVAGASSPSTAPGYCGASFLGTSTWMVQYPSAGYDGDYWCGGSAPPVYAIKAAPHSTSAAPGTTAAVAITLSAVNGWHGIVSLAVTASTYVTASISPTATAVPGQARLRLSATTSDSYTITVTATPSASSTTHAVHTTSVTFSVP